jgi:hypothetical protein
MSMIDLSRSPLQMEPALAVLTLPRSPVLRFAIRFGKGGIALLSQRMSCLRRIHFPLAVLIALSLVVAPLASARAHLHMPAQDHAASVADDAMADMSDCAKIMAAGQTSKCPCCDAPAKAPCPDGGACLVKCGMQVLGMLVPSTEIFGFAFVHDRPGEAEKPPDRSLRPPAPPPRV